MSVCVCARNLRPSKQLLHFFHQFFLNEIETGGTMFYEQKNQKDQTIMLKRAF